jgi:hypothetical protein
MAYGLVHEGAYQRFQSYAKLFPLHT